MRTSFLSKQTADHVDAIRNVLVKIAAVKKTVLFIKTKCFNVFLGLLAIDAAIIGGRFWVVTNNRFTHFYFIIMALLAAIVLALSFNI